MGYADELTVSDWRDLYEGMTQEDDGFRKKMAELVPGLSADNLLSELELSQNRLTYAMMGIHPIYRREIELSGFINYPEQQLVLYAENGDRIVPFTTLDPSYVEFLENQKRTHVTKDIQPLSSVALRASQEMYPGLGDVIEPVDMNTDGAKIKCSSNALSLAWSRSVILMNHLHEEMQKYGLDTAYGVSRDDLRAYCNSNIGSAQFDRGIAELGQAAAVASDMDCLVKQV